MVAQFVQEYGGRFLPYNILDATMQALGAQNKRQVRWHPMIIRWVLYLHYKSSGAYKHLESHGLSSTRTLIDYRHFGPHCQAGFYSYCRLPAVRSHQTKET